MTTVHRLVAMLVTLAVLTSGLTGVAAADSTTQTSISVDATAVSPDGGTTFASTQTRSNSFSGDTPIVSASAGGSAGGGAAVGISLETSL